MFSLNNLSSGSKGNCYIVNQDGVAYILDLGIDLQRIAKRINLNDVNFAFVSHNHKDHSKSLQKFVLRGVNVIEGKLSDSFRKVLNKGNLSVYTFPVQHGDEKNGGCIVKTENECLLYITDFTICKYDLSSFKFTQVMVECNYLDQLIKVNDDVKTRRQINTHMSMEGLRIFLKTLDLTKCENIYLLHLSDGYGDKNLMKNAIERCTNKRVGVCLQEGGIYYGRC